MEENKRVENNGEDVATAAGQVGDISHAISFTPNDELLRSTASLCAKAQVTDVIVLRGPFGTVSSAIQMKSNFGFQFDSPVNVTNQNRSTFISSERTTYSPLSVEFVKPTNKQVESE